MTAAAPRIAVIGSGIGGMAAAWYLSSRHAVTLFEADDRLGGHTATIDVTLDGRDYAIDTGFIVFNNWTYPHFQRLMARLGVASQATEMSFSVHETAPVAHPGGRLAGLYLGADLALCRAHPPVDTGAGHLSPCRPRRGSHRGRRRSLRSGGAGLSRRPGAGSAR